MSVLFPVLLSMSFVTESRIGIENRNQELESRVGIENVFRSIEDTSLHCSFPTF